MLDRISINRDTLIATAHGASIRHWPIEHHYPNRYEWNDPPAFHIVTTTLDDMAQAMRDAYHVPVTIE